MKAEARKERGTPKAPEFGGLKTAAERSDRREAAPFLRRRCEGFGGAKQGAVGRAPLPGRGVVHMPESSHRLRPSGGAAGRGSGPARVKGGRRLEPCRGRCRQCPEAHPVARPRGARDRHPFTGRCLPESSPASCVPPPRAMPGCYGRGLPTAWLGRHVDRFPTGRPAALVLPRTDRLTSQSQPRSPAREAGGIRGPFGAISYCRKEGRTLFMGQFYSRLLGSKS